MARKTTPLEPIETDQRFAAAAAILHTLEEGLRQIDREADALRVEDYLENISNKGIRDPRAPILQKRVKEHRAASGREKAAEAAPSANPVSAVDVALDLVRAGRRTTRRDRTGAVAQLENDRVVVREGIFAQQAVVDDLRGKISFEVAQRLKESHRELILAQYRAAQALAAATDAEREFRRQVSSAGYSWRADITPALTLRAALILGSEAAWDSEISRARRVLEELKVLQ
jgi:hypothetical protein